MSKKSNVTVLLDVDNTILNIDLVKAYIADLIDVNYGKGASDDFGKIYEEVRDERGFIDSKEIAIRFARFHNSEDHAPVLSAFQEVPFKQFLFSGAAELIDFLVSNTFLIIFSEGDKLFQKTKIQRLGLFEIADEIIISESKKDLLHDLLKKYDNVIVVDDKPEILQKAKQTLSDCKTILVKLGKHTNARINFKPDFVTNDLSKVEAYIKSSYQFGS